MSEGNKFEQESVYRILIVDDEKDVLEAAALAVRRAKEFQSEVILANDYDAAMAEMAKGPVDLILSDFKMPGKNGIDLLMSVREKSPETVRILMTGYSDLNVAKDAINKAAVYSYIEKPWDVAVLRMTLNEALRHKSVRDSGVSTADSVRDGLRIIEEYQGKLKTVDSGTNIPKQKVVIEFASAAEFNLFSFELKRYKNASIDDIQVFESKYIIVVTVYPESIRNIM